MCFLIENRRLNCFKLDGIQEYEEKKKLRQVRRLEALQAADAQSTGLGRRSYHQKSPLDGAVYLSSKV